MSPFNLLDVYSYADPQMLLTQHTFYVRAIDLFEPEFPDPQKPELRGQPRPDAGVPHLDSDRGHAGAGDHDLPRAGGRRRRRRAPSRTSSSASTTRRRRSSSSSSAPSSWRRSASAAAEWEPCESPHSIGGLEPGDYTFGVRAVDLMGNAGPAATRGRHGRRRRRS